MATVCNAPDCGKTVPPATGSRPRLYCNSTCRRRAHDARKAGVQFVTALPTVSPEPGPVEAATLSELTAIDRADSALGQAALTLARRVDRGAEVPTGLSALVKQLEATLHSIAQAARQAQPSALDRMRDELAERRAQQGA